MYNASKHSEASCALQVGCSTPEEVRRNVATVYEAFGEQISAESEVLAEINKVLEHIQGVGWPSGLPENN